MSASKITWLVTVGLCVVAAVVLLVEGYTGYSITVGAVGLAAAVNVR